MALHAGSDAIISLAYFSIPLTIAAVVRRRPDLKYGWVAYLLLAFIVASGATHLLSLLTLWVPAYRLEGLVKLAAAILSIATAVILWPLVPRLAAIPSEAQLTRANCLLATKIEEQDRTAALLRDTEARIRSSNVDLERRVAERTAELTAANNLLTEVLAQRISAQQALARSEEEFRASFEGVAVGKVQGDPVTGRIIRANRAFAQMLGHEPEELVGRLAWEFTWPDDQEADMAAYERVLAGLDAAYIREKRYVGRDGQPIWGRISATIIRRPETGEPVLTVAVIEDIDDRHKAQVALQAAKRDLEQVVDERTAALTQRDLLLREVYHRVKNNLQIVDSLLVMQARQLSDPGVKTALLSLRSRVFALGLVHHQLMGSENLKTFEIAPFLQELSVNILDGSAAENISLSVRAISLSVGLDFAIPLALLVTELVTNSLKHAFAGGKGTIEVLLDRSDDGLVLVISDNGRGYELSAGPSGGPKAALGTSIIKGLVAQLGGTIVVHSENGTRTEIHLPTPVVS